MENSKEFGQMLKEYYESIGISVTDENGDYKHISDILKEQGDYYRKLYNEEHKDKNISPSCNYCAENSDAKIKKIRIIYEYENPNAYGYPEVCFWNKKITVKQCPICGRRIYENND